MDRPEVGAVAEQLNQELAPLLRQDAAYDWIGLCLLGAVGSMYQDLDDLIRDSDAGPGWSGLFDLWAVKSDGLAYLAQYRGVRLRAGLSDERQRERVISTDGMLRGGRVALEGAARQYLTGDQHVNFIERSGSAWQITVVTRTSETPDPDQVEAALLEQKPAGIVLTYVVSDAPIINEGTRTIDAAAGTIDSATLANIT